MPIAHSSRLSAVALLGIAVATASAGPSPTFEYEINGFVTSSLVDGVAENDPVSLIFLVDPNALPIDLDRGDGEENNFADFPGAQLIGLSFGSTVYTSDTADRQTVINDFRDEYFTSWRDLSGPAPVGRTPGLLTLSLEGGDDPLQTATELPSASQFDQLATEGTGVLRFDSLIPITGSGLTPTIVFSTVPAPGTLAAIGMLTLGATRRRRGS